MVTEWRWRGADRSLWTKPLPKPARAGTRALAVSTDVANPDSVRALFRQDQRQVRAARSAVQQRRRRRAGVPLEELTFEQWQSVVDINLTGSFLCARRRRSS
jgi:NAD(P)-dependent dehydrogenase (short-subunit alcohol dehydrogenase family)